MVVAMTISTGLVTMIIPASAITASAPCRVRNVTQDSRADSLIRTAEAAVDGDRLLVHGTCSGVVIIDTDIVIQGRGEATLTGRDRTRVMRIWKGAWVTLRDLVITRGGGVKRGAGIANDGNLTLLDVTVKGNSAKERGRGAFWGWGGGIANMGRLLLEDSTVRRNEALQSAGGIHNGVGARAILRRTTVTRNATIRFQADPYGGGGIENYGRLRVVGSTITNNRTQDNGGGIYNGSRSARATVIRSTIARNEGWGGGIQNEGTLIVSQSAFVDNDESAIVNWKRATLTDSTVSGNTGLGGGLVNYGTLRLVGTSVTGNTARREGGGIRNDGGTVTLDGTSTVTGNVPDDCVGTPAC
jgi:hypothetical protein